MSRRAYLDYAATAPFDTRLADAMAAASWANANALYTEGRAAANQLEDARKRIAAALGAHAPSELTFTSGGSESDNTAIRGLAKPVPGAKSTHVVVSSIEHDAVLNSAKALKSEGFVIDKIDPDASGIVRPEALQALLASIEGEGGAVTLVAVQAVNNELGTIQPVRALARVAHAHQARFFSDAVQGLGKLDIDLEQSGVDAAAFSAHKMCGPTGIGILYGKLELLDAMDPLYLGGDSNARFDMCGNIQLKNAPYKFESGTQPIEGIFGLHAALQYIQSIGRKNIHAWEMELHDYAIRELRRLDNIEVYNPDADTGIITFNVKNVFAQDAATFFNANGIAVRSGQHCAKLLNNMLDTSATIRASFYLYTSYADVDRFLDVCRRATMEACLDVFF